MCCLCWYTKFNPDSSCFYFRWFRSGPNRKAIYIEERAFVGSLNEINSNNEDSNEPSAGCSSQNTGKKQNKMVHGSFERFQDFIEGNMFVFLDFYIRSGA